MAKYNKKSTPSDETIQESEAMAKSIQKPGQSKEQTKLIAQGIQKGIELYKKQHKEKSRELNKKLKKLTPSKKATENTPALESSEVVVKQHWLPWVLLVVSWSAMMGYWLMMN